MLGIASDAFNVGILYGQFSIRAFLNFPDFDQAVARPPDPIEFMPYSTMVSIRLSSRVDKFLVFWCFQQVRFLAPVIRELMALVKAH